MGWLSENVDELIALILVIVFSALSIRVTLSCSVEELRGLVQSWSPVILPVIGFYFGSKTARRAARG